MVPLRLLPRCAGGHGPGGRLGRVGGRGVERRRSSGGRRCGKPPKWDTASPTTVRLRMRVDPIRDRADFQLLMMDLAFPATPFVRGD